MSEIVALANSDQLPTIVTSSVPIIAKKTTIRKRKAPTAAATAIT